MFNGGFYALHLDSAGGCSRLHCI